MVLTAFQKVEGLPEGARCVVPEFLHAGDTIALIAPSYFTADSNVFRAAEVLRGWGFEPLIGPNACNQLLDRYAGTVSERVADFMWAVREPSIKAIICIRGGYGTIQMIDSIPAAELTANPKWLVGYSDISTLHGMETCAGVASIHGTMATSIGKNNGEDVSSVLLREMLTGTIPIYKLPAHPCNIAGEASGTLVGGNICTFAPNLGTAADATACDGIILFIEEVGESLHNIDRQLNMLLNSGIMERCKGVILGEFTESDPDLGYESAEQMLVSYFSKYGIPVCCGFPAGHDEPNLPLMMGAEVNLKVKKGGATVSFSTPGHHKRHTTPLGPSTFKQPED